MAAEKPELIFVTGNAGKRREVEAMLGDDFPFALTHRKIDLPELQGEPEEIVRAKAVEAFRIAGAPVLVEDTSLCFNALNGLPGPYIKDFLGKLGLDGLNRVLSGYEDKGAVAQCIFGLAESADPEAVVMAPGRVPGTIVPARGPTNFGWDPVFQPEDSVQTFAEMDGAAKNAISHRSRALQALRAEMAARSS